MPQLRTIVLPILGAIAAILAFKIASPWEATLDRGLDLTDPRALYTFGTTWGAVNRIAFGALICGPFCFTLTFGRRSSGRVILGTALATVIGAGVNFVTDSLADIIGIALSSRMQMAGSMMAMLAWCVMVPAGIAFTLTVSTGITPQRITRAIFATKIAAMASLGVQVFGSVLGGVGSGGGEGELLRSQIPLWRMVEIAVGIALGLTIAIADERIRLGSIRLIHGTNEFRDWSLDHATNRVGSAEVSEIPLFGFRNVEPLHALIVRQGPYFFLDPRAPVTVNGHPIAAAVALNPGDRIAIGDAQLVFYTRDLMMTSQYMGPAPVASPIHFAAGPARLLFESTGQELRLPPGRYGVGREAGNAVCLANDSRISRRHAELLVSDTGLTLIDLGSKNGTLLNGARMAGQVALVPGDVMEFGSAKFTYQR
jgi:hypothetical protein